MPSRAELEIVEAENEDLKRQVFELQRELETARGAANLVIEQAESAGVSLSIPKTPDEVERRQIEVQRKGLEDDIQALHELRNPPAINDTKPETALDIVRANQRERKELNERLASANMIVNRVAAILGVQTWDHEGTEIRDAVQRLVHLRIAIKRKSNGIEAEISRLSKGEREVRAELAGWLRSLQWVVEQMNIPAPIESTPTTVPDDVGVMFTLGEGRYTIVRPHVGPDAGVLDVLVCRGDLVEQRLMISDLQVDTAREAARSPRSTDSSASNAGPYR